MRKHSPLLLTLAFLALAGDCISQDNPFYLNNIKGIESFISSPLCGGNITYPERYNKTKVKSDGFIVPFLNSIFGNQVSLKFMENQLKKWDRKKAFSEETDHGMIKVWKIILKGYYLRAEIVLEFIDTTIIRRNVELSTSTHGFCNHVYYRLFDFNLGVKYFFKDLKLPLRFDLGFFNMVTDTIYTNNLASLKEQRKDYRFNIPGSSSEDWINEVFRYQYNLGNDGAYAFYSVPKYIVRLIKENRTSVINDLLYSPNYLISIEAMEALIYLSSIGKFTLSQEDIDRIALIKSVSIVFYQADSDVYNRKEGYKALNITDERVIKKYSRAM